MNYRARRLAPRSVLAPMFCGICLIALVGYLLVVTPSASMMATFTVNSTDDSVDASPGDGTCADALNRCTLRAAVMEANANVGADTITVPAGTYTLTLGPNDDEENFDGAREDIGDLDVLNGDLTINGAGAGSTIIDGGGLDRIIEVNDFAGPGVAVDLTISGVTLRNGSTHVGDFGYFAPGGAIQFDGFDITNGPSSKRLTLNNCRVTSNRADAQGGGVSVIFGALTINNTEFSGNQSTHATGGAVAYDAGAAAASGRTLGIADSSFSNNTAPDPSFGDGGAVQMTGNSTFNVATSSFSGNTAGASGGAISSDAFLASNVKTITLSKFESNSAKQGGGVFSRNGQLTFDLNVVVGNTASAIAASSGFMQSSSLLGSTFSVINNWWGCNVGPAFAPCDRAFSVTGVVPGAFLVLSHAATPNSVATNASTSLQADFFTPSSGSALSAADLVALEGRTITFSNPFLGALSGADTQISGGKANATYTAGASGGSGSADATVDQATATAFINITEAPSVTTNPTDQTVCAGSNASFMAAAGGLPAPTVQWQVSANGGGSFSDIPGATSTTLTFSTVAADNGNQYRAVFTNGSGSTTTTAATLTVNTAPVITQNPIDVAACNGSSVSFSAAASGGASVQWQVSTNGGATFADIPGATSGTLTFTATTAQNGYKYRAVFTNGCSSANSTAATLTIGNTTPPVIVLSGNVLQLWAPNHAYHTITIADVVASATDSCSGNVLGNVVITSVSSDETENGNGDGNTSNDILIGADCKSVQLRAERQASGNGRVYRINLKVTDLSGNVTTATAKVYVPKSQNGGGAVDDGPGGGYTVTSACP